MLWRTVLLVALAAAAGTLAGAAVAGAPLDPIPPVKDSLTPASLAADWGLLEGPEPPGSGCKPNCDA